jgi:hypothetical protein
MAGSAIPDGTVGIGPADAVALLAPAGHRRTTFQLGKRVGRPTSTTGLIRLREIYLFGRKALLAVNGCPCRSGMSAMQELLINVLVAASTISRGQLCRDYESMMVFLVLARSWLMAIKTIHSFLGVHTHFVFVYYRILSSRMTFSALSGSTHQVGAGLLGFGLWPGTIDQECGQY